MGEAELYTIGHSNHPIEVFLGMLKEHGIKLVVDVRSTPYSRFQKHFNRESLVKSLQEVGIDYLFGGKQLGGLTPISINDRMFKEKMRAVVSLSMEKPTVLMCSERDPKGCHRGMKLTAWVLRNTIEFPQHIVPDGLIDAKAFEEAAGQGWLWHEFGGKYKG